MQQPDHFNCKYDNEPHVNQFGTDCEKNMRGKNIFYKNGKRIFNRPVRKIEACFDIETVKYEIPVVYKATGTKMYIPIDDRNMEMIFRASELGKEVIFLK